MLKLLSKLTNVLVILKQSALLWKRGSRADISMKFFEYGMWNKKLLNVKQKAFDQLSVTKISVSINANFTFVESF